MRKTIAITPLLIFGILTLIGCNSAHDNPKTQLSSEASSKTKSFPETVLDLTSDKICEKTNWNKIEVGLKENEVNPFLFYDLETYSSSCSFSLEEFRILLDIYNTRNDDLIRRKILEFTNSYNNRELIKSNVDLLNFYKTIATQEKAFLATEAIKVLVLVGESNLLMELYSSRKDSDIRKTILERLDEISSDQPGSTNSNLGVIKFYESVAQSDDEILAPIALRVLLDVEGGERSPKWQNWLWSDTVLNLLEEAVNKDLYKLTRLTYHELLALSKRYPNSLFTKGCKDYYLAIDPQASYFEWKDFGHIYVGIKGVFRQPFNPQVEPKIWTTFLNKYPGHPASDNASYRLARVYEAQGDYDNALLWYYTAYQSPDGDMREFAGNRTLFIIDLLMSSKSLESFIEKHPNHPLIPSIQYSKAIHLIREGNFSLAKSELETIFKEYNYSNFINLVYGVREPYLGPRFWYNLKQQVEQVGELSNIRTQPSSDQKLYQEAVFNFDSPLVRYNYLWRGSLSNTFQNFMPENWDGVSTSTKFSMESNFIEKANQSYKQQIGWLESIKLLQQLLRDYPNSELREKSQYSIALNYYQLSDSNRIPYLVLDEQAGAWENKAVESFTNFVKAYPTSSMADDALLSIADVLMTPDRPVTEEVMISRLEMATTIVQKLINEYPNGDRRKEAEQYLNRINEQLSSLKQNHH